VNEELRMSLDRLLEKIEEDARAEGERLVSVASEDAAGIKGAGEEEARISAQEIRDSFRERGQRERTRIMSEALTESRSILLSTQEELFEEVFEEAKREFESLTEERYRAWLKRTILDNAGEGDQEVIASPYDRGLLAGGLLDEINAALREKGHEGTMNLSEEVADFHRGVILRGAKYANNLSLQSQVRELRERHEQEVLRILFGEVKE
jgi:V/A-type H+-transporting ATPase subunit E